MKDYYNSLVHGITGTPTTFINGPRGIVLLPVVDMDVRLSFNLIWKKDNSSRLLQRFVAQVEALGRKKSVRADAIKETAIKETGKLRNLRTPNPQPA